jgi:hypothetical protein
MLVNCHERPLTIRNISGGDDYRMGQALRINHNMALDAGHFFTGIITFAAGAIRILDALCINDAETRLGVAPLSGMGLANLIFLMPAPADWCRLQVFRSTVQNNDGPYVISENRSATCATGSRSLASTEWHRTPHTNPLYEVGFSCGHFPAGL